MAEHLLGSEFDKPDRIAFHLQFVKKFIGDLGVSMTLRPPDEKQFGELIVKAKKVQYVATLGGTLLQVWLRGGKAKALLVGSKDLDSVRDNAKARGILEKLADTTKLITRQQISLSGRKRTSTSSSSPSLGEQFLKWSRISAS